MSGDPLPASPVTLPTISFGTASLGNLYEAISDAQARDVLQTAWTVGLRYFDTAPHYGRGLSETRLGTFLAGRDGAIVSTKVGRVLSPAAAPIAEADGFVNPAQNDVRYDYSGEGFLESFEQSCARLGRRDIDILYVHDLGEMVHGPAAGRYLDDFLSSGYDALRRLKDQGRIRAIGLGVNEVEICLEILSKCDLDLILLAGRHTLLDRSAAVSLLPLCQTRGVGIVIGGVFNSGILATGPIDGAHYNYAPASRQILDQTAALQQICAAYGVSLSEAALQFPGRHPAVVSTLIGTSKPGYIARNLAGLARPLPLALWAELEATP